MNQFKTNETSLTEQEKIRYIQWLHSREAVRPCSTCGHLDWHIGDHYVGPWTMTREGRFKTEAAYTYISMFCGHCTHTVFFNATVINAIIAQTSHG